MLLFKKKSFDAIPRGEKTRIKPFAGYRAYRDAFEVAAGMLPVDLAQS
jgi:hypothetical protein